MIGISTKYRSETRIYSCPGMGGADRLRKNGKIVPVKSPRRNSFVFQVSYRNQNADGLPIGFLSCAVVVTVLVMG